jgi:DnaJ-domain-containing protein 1
LPADNNQRWAQERALPSLERWRREMLAKVEAAGDYPAGFDPSLAVHFGALGLPLGSGEADIRKAYRELVVENHPDR